VARSGLSVEVLLVVHVGLFNQQMKNFCEKHQQHRQWWAVFVDVWSLTFLHTFCWTDKRMNICIPSLRWSPGWWSAACRNLCFAFCWGLLLLLLWILFFFFLLQIVFKITGLRTWFRVGISNQNFTDGFLVKFYFFPAIAIDTYNSLPYLHSSVWLGTVRNLMRLRYEHLLQWQQNRSKAMM